MLHEKRSHVANLMLLLTALRLINVSLRLAIIFLAIPERFIYTTVLLHLLLTWIWTLILVPILLLLLMVATAGEINVLSLLKEKLYMHTYPESCRAYPQSPIGHHANG